MEESRHTLPPGPKLNLGCGPVQPEGWVNIDGSNRAFLASKLNWLDRLLVAFRIIPPTEFNKGISYHNLHKGIPYPDKSAACIYAGELWEHFEYDDACWLTNECYRVLKNNGVLRVCVPDGASFWQKYLDIYASERSKPQGDQDPEKLVSQVQSFFNYICTRRVWLGSMGHTHKWSFDEIQLTKMLERSRFSDVTRKSFLQSRIPGIERVETSDLLIVEGVKQEMQD